MPGEQVGESRRESGTHVREAIPEEDEDKGDLTREESRPVVQSSSVVEMALKRSHTLGQSGLWSVNSTALVSKMFSNVVDSIASSHAVRLLESESRTSTSTMARHAALHAPPPQESRLPDRSVWKDPEVMDLLGKVRLDALGENVIWSKEGSEETLQGVFAQFDVEDEKPIEQIMTYRDEDRSLREDFSQAGSLITTLSPPEIPVPELEAEHVPTRTVSMDPALFESKPPEVWAKSPVREPSRENLIIPEPVRVPSPVVCDFSKFTCFAIKEEISVKELMICPPDEKASALATVVHVKFRLATGQILKRFYKPDVIFRNTLSELSQILRVPEDSLQLFFENEPLNLEADVRVCQEPGAEVLIVADVPQEHLFSLLEKGIISFEDDRALDRFLLRQVPCEAERKASRSRPATPSPPPDVPHPSSFIPGLADHRKRDSAINSELERRLELTNCVRWIQSSFRRYLSKRDGKELPAPQASAHMKASDILMKDPRLFTQQDFTLLYSMLGKWWRHEADTIKRNNSGAAKIARLYNLLLKEIGFMRSIEQARFKLKEHRRMARALSLINNITAADCSWEYIQGFLPLWKRAQLWSTNVSCKRSKCQKCRISKEGISRDMRAVIAGDYTRRSGDCRCLCSACRRFLPCRRFPLDTGSARISRCDQCQGLSDASAARVLMEGVRKDEARRRTCSWLSYIMQEKDFAKLAQLWHNVSAISGASRDLCLVRWDPDEEWSPWNTILLTQEEARAHLGAHGRDAYAPDFVKTVRQRHLTAKWTFKDLLDSEKVIRGRTRAWNDDRFPYPNLSGFHDEQSLKSSLYFPEGSFRGSQNVRFFPDGESLLYTRCVRCIPEGQSLLYTRCVRCIPEGQSFQNSQGFSSSDDVRRFEEGQSFQGSQSLSDTESVRCFQDGQSFQSSQRFSGSQKVRCFKEGQSFQGSQSLPDTGSLGCFQDGQSFQSSQRFSSSSNVRCFKDGQSFQGSRSVKSS